MSDTPRNGRPKGFTLLELVVVLVLLALVAGLVFQRVGGSAEIREAKIFARELAAFLKAARTSAVQTGAPSIVWIDTDACRTSDRHVSVPEILRLETEGLRTTEEGAAYLRFEPDGGASGGLLRVYTTEQPVAVLRIDAFTGAIEAVGNPTSEQP